jgi:hypothetical protein
MTPLAQLVGNDHRHRFFSILLFNDKAESHPLLLLTDSPLTIRSLLFPHEAKRKLI